MRCLIRKISRRKSGVVHDDKHFQGDKLTIGRATDQDVFLTDLRVALQHAVIAVTKNRKYQIQALSLAGVIVNNHPVKSARLSIGDVISIADYQITVTNPPEGCDLALEIEELKPEGGAESALAARSRMTLAATGLTRRKWSWAFFLILLSVFLIFPVSGSFNDGWRNTLRATPVVGGLISDASWDSGPVANPHQFIGKDCNQCHATPFRMAQDYSCVQCHSAIEYHADPEQFQLPELTDTRCATCHREHNSPIRLVEHDEGLCSDCHADLKERAPDTDLLNAWNFGEPDGHPEFRPTLLSYRDGKTFEQRISLADKPEEQSNLKFNHKKHLEGELRPENGPRKTLECADCHQMDAGGVAMKPINMETMCSECHSLTFDPQAPDRKVPHGISAMAAYENILEYYNTRALQGDYKGIDAPDFIRTRARPGGKRSLTEDQVEEAYAWAQMKTLETASVMFEDTTCNTCHTIEKTSEKPPEWQVLPVRVADIWMPKARFSHQKHETMACEDCHQAKESETATDVLLPQLASCQECHGGDDATDKLRSACVDCHSFHIDGGHIMGKNARLETTSGLTGLLHMITGSGSDAGSQQPAQQ